MKIRALHLTNVRKFTGKHAAIIGIGDGITVVSEANEFGKSTFFDALHALFFEKYGSAARPVKSLQPYSGGAVEIAAEIETDEGGFRVEKRFLAKKMARVVRLSDNSTIAQDDEAERWISQIMGAGDGPAGLLWVRQGLVGLESDVAKEKTALTETRRDLLSSVAGEIDAMTGGKRMDRVMRRLNDDLSAIATKTGRKSGAWKAASDVVEALEAEHQALAAQVATLQDALSQRRADEALLARLDHPDAKARRDSALAAARGAAETARAHAGLIAAAVQDRDIAALRSKDARAELNGFLLTVARLSETRSAATLTFEKADSSAAAAGELGAECRTARTAAEAAQKSVAQARARLDATRQQIDARKARAAAATLAVQIAKASAVQSEFDTATARVNASHASPAWLSEVETVASNLVRMQAVIAAHSATLRLDYTGSTRVERNGQSVTGGQDISLAGRVELVLPGIGAMVIQTQSEGLSGSDGVTKATAQQQEVLAKAGADDLQGARVMAANRAEALRKADLARAVLATLAPAGIAALQAEFAAAELAATGALDDELLPLAALSTAVTEAEAKSAHCADTVIRLERAQALAREDAVRARAVCDAARDAYDLATATAGPAAQHESRRAALLQADAAMSEDQRQAEAKLADLQADAPDLVTIEAELTRATASVTAAATQLGQLEKRLAGLRGQIETLAGNGIEERSDDVAGQLVSARLTEARLAQKAAALMRLQTALEAERAAAQETYFGPVQRELKPLLAILHHDAALSFDSDSLLPTGLSRGMTEEMLDDLSGGTREQIAILTRLAFARLFAKQGRHLPIVLDDALVYSDDDRIIKMFTALTRVAQDQQIIVFSCRQLAFQDLGGARPLVSVSEA